jgi:hypothetical protein
LPIDLGDRGSKALAQLRLQRLQLLALSLQILRLAEVQLQLDDADECAHLTKVLPLRRRRSGVERLLDLSRLEKLEDVLLFDVGEAVEHDPALLAGLDLVDVVLEAA